VLRCLTFCSIALLLCLQTPDARAGHRLFGGSIRNITDACGEAKTLTVQFFGDVVSPRLTGIESGAVREVSLSRGLYDVTIQDVAGTVVDSTRLYVGQAGFRFDMGCVPAEAKAAKAPADAVDVWFANTSGDCGTPKDVVFRLNGVDSGKVADGVLERVSAVPSKDALLEVLHRGKRIFAEHFPRLKKDGFIYYGCTDPGIRKERSGISVLFKNSTDLCTDTGDRRYLTLWVDGRRTVGLAPGTRTSILMSPGEHELAVHVGLTREKVLKGKKRVTAPFMVRFGCGK